jgi:hypothetical protein
MTNDAELTVTRPATKPATLSAAAERMRRHRERRRDGLRCLTISYAKRKSTRSSAWDYCEEKCVTIRAPSAKPSTYILIGHWV